MKISSFDVFDTVLTRRVGSPRAVFPLLAERIASGSDLVASPAVFVAAREREETRLNQLLGRHASLEAIHDAVATALGAGPETGRSWARQEEELERELTVPVPEGIRLVRAARERGEPVVFVSDTPHSESFVRELLLLHAVASHEDKVFTSAGRGVSKSGGGLFTLVAELMGGDHHFSHRGDNLRSDVGSARLESWSAGLVTGGRLTRYEHLLEEHAQDTLSFTSWLAGGSRIARLEAVAGGVSPPLAGVASGVMAPMLIGYAHWVVTQARLRGIKRLYFVARDGEVMLRVAERVIGRLAPDIELRYLYGSRQAWIFGACASSDDVLRRWVRTKADNTARTALARVCLTPELVHGGTGLEFCSPDRADTLMSAAERKLLSERLLESPLVDAVREGASASAERVLAYLEQEGLRDGVPSALVDAGWSGRTAAAFDHLLGSVGVPPVTHFVMGIMGDQDDARARADVVLVPWLFDAQTYPASTAGFPSANVLVEMFCASATGRTLDYALRDEEWVPVRQMQENAPVQSWGMPRLQDVAVRVVELVVDRLPAPGAVDARSFAWDVMRAFWMKPTPQEAESWGDFPWEEEVAQPFVPIAQRVSATTLAERARRGEFSVRRSNSWRSGSALVSRQPWRGLLTARTRQEELRPRLARIPRRVRLEIAQRASRRFGAP